jgi:hypothetical protein
MSDDNAIPEDDSWFGPSEEEDSWYDPAQIEKKIAAESQQRRADPLACLAEFLKTFWMDNTDAEVRLVWRHRVGAAPWYARDMLYCLDAVIANPPAGIEKFVREKGGVYLYHDDGSATLYSDAETLAWLKRIAQEFRAIFEAPQPGDAAENER